MMMIQVTGYSQDPSFALCCSEFQNNRNDEASEQLIADLKAQKEELEATLSREQLQTVQLKEDIAQAETRNAELTKASHLSLTLCFTSFFFFLFSLIMHIHLIF
jgi:septal ring factor EnvC (AmiA/AmiB activator)